VKFVVLCVMEVSLIFGERNGVCVGYVRFVILYLSLSWRAEIIVLETCSFCFA
jgi:hypothetical protein